MRTFKIPERLPIYGCTPEDYCKFWSYLFVNREKKFFTINREEKCSVCGNSQKLKIHHIIPFAQFGNHSEDNLIILCKECHNDVHYRNLKLEKRGVLDLKWIEQYNQLINLSRKFSRRIILSDGYEHYEFNNHKFKTEVIDKINLIFDCSKLSPERTSHIPIDKFVIKLPTIVKEPIYCNHIENGGLSIL